MKLMALTIAGVVAASAMTPAPADAQRWRDGRGWHSGRYWHGGRYYYPPRRAYRARYRRAYRGRTVCRWQRGYYGARRVCYRVR